MSADLDAVSISLSKEPGSPNIEYTSEWVIRYIDDVNSEEEVLVIAEELSKVQIIAEESGLVASQAAAPEAVGERYKTPSLYSFDASD